MFEKDQRKSQRIAVELPMQVETTAGDVFLIKTWDFSASGVFLAIDATVKQQFAMDDTVKLQFQGTNYTPPVIQARVIRITDTGIGLKIEDELVPGDADSKP